MIQKHKHNKMCMVVNKITKTEYLKKSLIKPESCNLTEEQQASHTEIQTLKQTVTRVRDLCLPSQVKPLAFSLNPLLHEQVQLPSAFEQLCSHPPLASAHSSVSVKIKWKKNHFSLRVLVSGKVGKIKSCSYQVSVFLFL